MIDPMSPRRAPVAEPRRWPLVRLAVAAALAGVVLGTADLALQRALPYPWANLANSLAVWAVAAWAFSALVARRPGPGALAGAVMLVVAVEAYYAAAALFLHDDAGLLVAPTTALWCEFGVVAGVVFGAGGGVAVDRRRATAVLGAALPAAVLVGEAAVMIDRVVSGALPAANVAVAALEAAAGVAITLAAAPARARPVRTLAMTALLAGAAFGTFAAVGIGFATA